MPDPSDHLLRTLAPVPVETRVLDLGCGDGVLTEALVQLGFDVFACDPSSENVELTRETVAVHVGEEEALKRVSKAHIDALGYPDEFFEWVVAMGSLARLESRDALLDALSEVRRVLQSGGWLYVTVPGLPDAGEAHGYAGDSGMEPTFTPRTLDELMEEADFAVSERPTVITADGRRVVQAIYRRVDD